MARTILIDADILAFQIAVNKEEAIEFNGEYVLHADLNEGIREVDMAIPAIIEKTDADQAVLFVTGKSSDNFRKTVLPSYKENRAGKRRPMILQGIKEYMKDNFKCFHETILEADDLMGIQATMPHKGERVIYSADKDLRTVPALHWNEEDGEVIEITPQAADLFFHEQILTGDPTDNYKGCPGVGKKGAQSMLNDPFKWVEQTHILKSGPNKGQERQSWVKEPVEVHNFIDLWPCIVSAYQKEGLTEEDALVQARCARILRHGEYNFHNQKVNLWTPN